MAWTNPSRGAPKRLRAQVMRRDNRTCQRCGNPATDVDHKRNRAEGGTDDLDNLEAICPSCHDMKTAAERVRGQRRSAAWRARRRKLPEQRHPGLI